MGAKRRRAGRKRLARRFARPEPLEPRIVLDGAAELAVIQPDQANRIGYELDRAFLDALIASAPDSAVHLDAGGGTSPVGGTVPWGNGLIFIDFSRIVSDDDYVLHVAGGGWSFLKAADTDDGIDGQSSQESDSTTLAPSDGSVVLPSAVVDDVAGISGPDNPAPRGVQDSADRGPPRWQTNADNGIGSDSRSRDWVGDGGLVDTPAVIPPPPTAAEFLPYEAIVQTDRGLAPLRIPAAKGGPESLASARSPDSSAAAAQRARLTQDEYFVTHEARRPVTWTAHSAASQSRQHVAPSDEGRETLSGKALSATTGLLETGLQSPPSPEETVLVAARSRHLTETSPPDSEQEIAAARDQFFARYKPMSVLAGISLVSAHLIADLRTTREERSRGRGRWFRDGAGGQHRRQNM